VLADVAPTLLQMMGINQPAEMTGQSLISAE
jgi:bisphosphoglycerate-independent phosphoglycerate mutase (AlkP superfamily)